MMVWINSVSHFSEWRYYRNLLFQWKATRKIYTLLRKRICQELYPKDKIFPMVILKNIQFRNIAIFDNLLITTASGLAETHFQAKRLCSIQSNKAEATRRALFWSIFLFIWLNLNSFWTVWANVNHLLKKSIIYNDSVYFGGWKLFALFLISCRSLCYTGISQNLSKRGKILPESWNLVQMSPAL